MSLDYPGEHAVCRGTARHATAMDLYGAASDSCPYGDRNVLEGTALLPGYFGLILGHLRTASVIIWERNGEANGRFYWLSSWRSASLVSPETVPVNSPVEAKKTGLFVASANTGTTVSVNERTPDAFLKRPVPPVI
jgi:hypothetical protein